MICNAHALETEVFIIEYIGFGFFVVNVVISKLGIMREGNVLTFN